MAADSQTLYRYGSTEVLRRLDGGRSVIVKRVARVDEALCAALLREQATLQRLVCPEIPRVLGWVSEAATQDLLIEDIGATSLDRLGTPLTLTQVLDVSAQVCNALLMTHRARLVHRDINPRNIVYNPATARAQLIDFGLAGQEVGAAGGHQEGTPAYFSPEQTGHTRHPVDHRSDLYALGVVMYQLISGTLPFEAADSALLFQQILSAPLPPLQRRVPGTPALVSDLVERLMHRDPAERYQSAAGLRHDLLALRSAPADDFVLGSHDRRESLVLPERLYGAAEHLAALRDFYAAAQRGAQPRIAMLRGEPGVGKSSLVGALHESVRGAQGLMLTGKHDANRRNVPFDSVRQLLAQLARQILGLPVGEVAVWRRRLQNSLGRSAGALVDVAPELQLLLGELEPVAALEPQQTENRLLALLRRFVEALGRGAPTLLFLDDLQWADAGTLKFVTMFADPALADVPVVLVGAYRGSEVDAAHPLARCLDDLAHRGLAPLALAVEPLSQAHLRDLLQDLFAGSDAAALAGLAEFIERRTQNNPFYVRELLAHCWRTRLVDFDAERGGFVWDAQQLAHASVPDGAVGLVMAQIETLSAEDAQLLGLAACLGSMVSEEVLQQVSARPVERALRVFLQKGLFVPADAPRTLRFAHDRIRQAAYDRLPADTLQRNHRALAQALRPIYDQGKCSIFELLEQVNAALETYTEAAERQQVAQWNEVGAHKARQALANATAERCLAVALQMLPTDLATQDPARYDKLHSELAVNLFMLGRSAEALALLAALLPLSAESMRVASIEALRIIILGSGGRGAEALQARDRALQALGYDKILGSKGAAPLKLLRLGWQTRAVDGETFKTVPRTTDPRAILVQRILSTSGVWAHEVSLSEAIANTAWAAMVIFRDGWTTHSAHGMSGWALLLALMHRATAAARLGAAARTLYAMGETPEWFGIELIVVNWIDGLTQTPAQIVAASQRCYEGARQAGDPVWSGLCVGSILGYELYVSIDRTLEVCERTAPLIKGLRNPMQMGMFSAWQSLCLCLAGRTDGPASLVSSAMDAATLEGYRNGGASATMSVCIAQVMACVVNGDYTAARAAVPPLLKTEFWRTAALASVASGLFYAAVALVKGTPADVPLARKLCKRIAALARGSAAGLGHGDVAHLFGLFAAARGDLPQALRHLGRALEAARRMGYLDRECLALEEVGRLHGRLGNAAQASVFLHQAHAAYTTWGARVRARQLAAELDLGVGPAHTNSGVSLSSRTSGTRQGVEWETLLEGMALCSRPLPAPELASLLADALQRSTGATRVAVLLHQNGHLRVVADTATAGAPPPNEAVVRTAVNMRRLLQPEDLQPSSEPLPKSLACAPMLYGERWVGALYLENEHVAGAFPEHRRELLERWTSQAAAAFHHAALREDLQQAVQAQTEQLRGVHKQQLEQQRVATEERMAGGFAHEMRNALSGAGMALHSLSEAGNPESVLTQLQVLAQGLPEEAASRTVAEELRVAQDLVDAAILGVDRASRVTDEILSYAQAGQVLASDAPTRLAAVVDAVLHEQASRLEAGHIRTTVQVDAALAVAAQESHVTLILRNLLRNSVDALSHLEGGERHLLVQASVRGRVLDLQVRDTAAGMDAGVQARVFEPFFTTKGTAGTGLGLGLSRKLARLHGGELTFVSTPGQGTTFALSLPTRGDSSSNS